MAQENIAKFEEKLRGDEALQAQLKELSEAYDGPKDDEQAIFDATLGQLAGGIGLPFTLVEARNYALAGGRVLEDAELEAVAGGGGLCIIIGGSSEPEAECDSVEGHACAYIGITIPDFTR